MPLFERRKTGYVATVAGAEMAALAGRMEEDVTAFSRRLAGRDVAPSGEIRVTTTDRPIFTRMGTEDSPRTGAIATRPAMRNRGHSRPLIQS